MTIGQIANMDTQKSTDTKMEYNKYIEQPWDIINAYFDGKHLEQMVRHQLESYNDFVIHQIPKLFLCLTQFIFVLKMLR